MRGLGGARRDKASAFRFLLRFNASVAQLPERDASNVGDEGESPSGSANFIYDLRFKIDDFCRVSPTSRGAPLRTGRLRVQILHAVPFGGTAPAAHVVQRRDGALKTRKVSVQIRPWAPPRVAQRRGVPLKTERLQVQVLPRGPLWNVNRTSGPGLGANECVPPGKWCKSTAFRQFG